MRVIAVPALLAGCAVDPEAAGEDLAGDDQNGIIFDDFAPSESCDLNIPLRCPNLMSFHLTTKTNFATGATSSRVISSTAAAAIRSDGKEIHCQPFSDTETSGIVGATRSALQVLPVLASDNSGVIFGSPVDRGYVCDGEFNLNAYPHGAVNNAVAELEDGEVTIDGRTQRVDLVGKVESFPIDRRTGMMTLMCKLTLPAGAVTTQAFKRPNDVIAVDRGRFVRGYEFTGNALREACGKLANQLCSNTPPQTIGGCITQERDKCVADFSQPDPCVRGPVEDPR